MPYPAVEFELRNFRPADSQPFLEQPSDANHTGIEELPSALPAIEWHSEGNPLEYSMDSDPPNAIFSSVAADRLEKMQKSIISFELVLAEFPAGHLQVPQDQPQPLTFSLNRSLKYPWYNFVWLPIWCRHESLHDLAKAYTMPINDCCRDLRHFQEAFRRCRPDEATGVLELLSATSDITTCLHRDTASFPPDWDSEWQRCRDALDSYIKELRVWWPHAEITESSWSSLLGSPITPTSGMTPPDSTLTTSTDTHPFGLMTPDMQHSEDTGGTLSTPHTCPCEVPTGPTLSCLHANERPKSSVTELALHGWIYYGQQLALSFSIYIRVFILILEANGRSLHLSGVEEIPTAP